MDTQTINLARSASYRTLTLGVFGLTILSAALCAVPVVENGRTRALIVVGDRGNAFHATAARDLQYHLERASGAKIPIAGDVPATRSRDDNATLLVVGAGPLSESLGVTIRDLEPEAYRVQTKGNHVVFVGRDLPGGSNATAWAVGHFLERHLGVRWLWPGELGTHVPERGTIEVPEIDVVGRPALDQRRLRSRGEGATGDWLRHHQMGSRMQYRFGHSFRDWWAKHQEIHPDYFALPPPGYKQQPREDFVKLREGNPAVVDRIIEEWRQAGRPDNWNVCANDGTVGWDTSEESRKLDLPDVFSPEDIWRGRANLSRRMVRFWNGLIVRMRQENPRVTLSTYAYDCYRDAPSDVKLEPGMVMGIVHTYANTEAWDQWHATGAKMILRPNWWHLGGSAPHIPLRKQSEYFLHAHANGMIGFDFDGLAGHWGTQGVLYYVIARLSVRPELTVDQVLDEFTGAFGAAAPAIREYLDYWEQFTTKVASPVEAGGTFSQNADGIFETVCRERGIKGSVLGTAWSTMPFIYTDEVIAPAERILKRAHVSAVGERELVRKRIRYLETALDLVKAHCEVIRLAHQKWRKPGETAQDFIRQLDHFEARRKSAVETFGPIGFDQTIPWRLRIDDPRKHEAK